MITSTAHSTIQDHLSIHEIDFRWPFEFITKVKVLENLGSLCALNVYQKKVQFKLILSVLIAPLRGLLYELCGLVLHVESRVTTQIIPSSKYVHCLYCQIFSLNETNVLAQSQNTLQSFLLLVIQHISILSIKIYFRLKKLTNNGNPVATVASTNSRHYIMNFA